MNDINWESLSALTHAYLPMSYSAYRASLPSRPKPIVPIQNFPVYFDSKVLTWADYAVCRP
jgi:hypothetical protein